MPSRSKATPQLPLGPTALYPAPAHVPGQPLASPGGEVSPSWPLSSPSRLPAGPAHPNCSRYRRLRGCDTLRGRGPETDMLGQQLPCSITVPAEGRDLGRSQWHFSSHQRLPSPAWLLLTPRELLLGSCALQSGKQSCDRDTRVHTNRASTPRPLESSGKILQKKCLFLPQMFIVVLLPALAG